MFFSCKKMWLWKLFSWNLWLLVHHSSFRLLTLVYEHYSLNTALERWTSIHSFVSLQYLWHHLVKSLVSDDAIVALHMLRWWAASVFHLDFHAMLVTSFCLLLFVSRRNHLCNNTIWSINWICPAVKEAVVLWLLSLCECQKCPAALRSNVLLN